ncbi:MAG: sugar phosphate isomerase/epimerase [Candidatus Hadarchaeales archaeon]
MKIGLSSLLFVNQSIENAIKLSAGLGAESVEIIYDIPHFQGYNRKRLASIRSILESYGLGVSVHTSFWDINPASHLSDLCDISLRQIKFGIDACRDLGGKVAVVHFGRCSIPEVELLRVMTERRYADFIERCSSYAGDRAVRIALENPGRDPRSYPGTFEELADVARRFGVGITFDIGHAHLFLRRSGRKSTGRAIAAHITKMRDLIVHFHVHDNNGAYDDHLPPGEGEIDFQQVANAVREIGYSGSIVLELWNPKKPLLAGKKGITAAKRIFTQS